MNFLLDKNPLEELYKLAHLPDLPDGFDPLGPFKGKHARIIVLQETIDEVRTKRKRKALELWLKANGATIHKQFADDDAFEAVRETFARHPRQAIRQGQKSDIGAFAFLHDRRHDRQHYAMVGRDADWADYRTMVKQEFVNPNHTSYAGISQVYVQEVLNGRMTTAQFAGVFDHLSAHDLPDAYGLRLSEIKDRLKAEANSKMGRKKPERVEKLKLELLEGYIEKARKASRIQDGKRVFTAKEGKNLGIVGGLSGGVLLEGLRRLSGPANAAEVGLVYKEVRDHLKGGNEDEAFKTIVRFAAETVGGSAAGAAAVGAATVLAGAAGVTLAPWALLATGVVAGVAGSLAVGEPAGDLAANFARHMAERHGEEDFTFDLLIEEARRFATGRGVDPDRFDEMLNPQKTGRLRALAENFEKGDRLPRRDPSEITLRGFTVDPSDPSYLVDDEAHYFNIRDGRGGEWQIAVDHKAIDNAPIVREDGHAFKRIELDDGTFFYSPKSRSIYAYVPRVYPALQRGERAIDPSPAPSPPGFLAPASPHYDPGMKIDFFGRPMRAGDLVDGDPDVGDVSYYPEDNDGNLISGPRQPRFRKVPIMDLLLKDGVLRNENGEVIRAST